MMLFFFMMQVGIVVESQGGAFRATIERDPQTLDKPWTLYVWKIDQPLGQEPQTLWQKKFPTEPEPGFLSPDGLTYVLVHPFHSSQPLLTVLTEDAVVEVTRNELEIPDADIDEWLYDLKFTLIQNQWHLRLDTEFGEYFYPIPN